MPFIHGRKTKVKVNNVDLSAYIEEASTSFSIETAETTTFGNSAKTYISGLRDATFSISGKFDPQASGIDATLSGLFQNDSVVCKYFPDGTTALSSINPYYQFNAIMTSYEVSSSVGDVITFSAEFQVTGNVTREASAAF